MKQNQPPETTEKLFQEFKALFIHLYEEDLQKATHPLGIQQAQKDLTSVRACNSLSALSRYLIDEVEMDQYEVFHALLEAWFGQIPEVLELALRKV